MPKRIQRKRVKGWKMPPNTVYVGRPTKWGNPFFDKKPLGSSAVEQFEEMIMFKMFDPDNEYIKQIKTELRGKDLACWCPLDKPCHADVLLEIANKGD